MKTHALNTHSAALAESITALILMGGTLATAHAKHACTAGQREKIRAGFGIAPVPLDLREKDRKLVGLGSYIVNAPGACTDCHTNPIYAPGGDPFKGEPEQENVEGYLAGGRMFGPLLPTVICARSIRSSALSSLTTRPRMRRSGTMRAMVLSACVDQDRR